jgi:hypothetical protein
MWPAWFENGQRFRGKTPSLSRDSWCRRLLTVLQLPMLKGAVPHRCGSHHFKKVESS